jgi:hypothetical protein
MWMSYAELGRLRGISAASAKRLSNRRRWRKQAGNDGTTRVGVPVSAVVPRETRPEDVSGDVSPFQAKALAALEGAVTVLHEQLDRAEAGRADASARADRAEQHAEELKAGQAMMIDVHARELAEAQQAAVELRLAEEARKARGRWARLRAAWRGE